MLVGGDHGGGHVRGLARREGGRQTTVPTVPLINLCS
jgi:hypothetical protein